MKQDLSKINIGPKFAGDDLKPKDMDGEEDEITEGQEPEEAEEEAEAEAAEEGENTADGEEVDGQMEDSDKAGKDLTNEASTSSASTDSVKKSVKRTRRKEEAKTGISYGANVFLNTKNKKLLAKAKIEKKREAMLEKRSQTEQNEDQNKPAKKGKISASYSGERSPPLTN